MGGVVVKVEDLWFRYAAAKDWVLRNLNLEVKEGEFVVIMGPSGCGKSTFIYTLNGIIPHMMRGEMKGRVVIAGMDTREVRPERLSQVVGMVFQNPDTQIITPVVIEEIAFGLENLNLSKEEIWRRVNEALEIAGLKGKEWANPRSLSGGERQALAIASVLALKPKILVLDEPTSMLDHPGTTRVLGFIERLREETKMTIIVVEHKIEWAVEHADRIIVMENGEFVADGTPTEVFSDVENVKRLGIRPPEVSELAYHLLDAGVKLPRVPVTFLDALNVMKGVATE